MKRSLRFHCALLLVLLLPGACGLLAGTPAFYTFDMAGTYRTLDGSGADSRAIRLTLSRKDSSQTPSLSLRVLRDAGANAADIGPAVTGMLQKIMSQAPGKILANRKIALPIAGYPARGRMVSRERQNGKTMSYFLFAFVDGKQRLHGVTLIVDGDDPPIPFEFDSALRTLAVEGRRGTQTEFEGTMVYRSPYANFYVVYPKPWQLILNKELKKPDVLCADPKGLSGPGSTEPVLFIHKVPKPGDALKAAARRYSRSRQKVATREIFVGPWPAVCSAYLDAASRIMIWDYDICTGRQTLRFTITQASTTFANEPPEAMRAALAAIYL